MGIAIKGRDPETRIRESLKRLEATIVAAGVGTIELREQQARRLVNEINEILDELDEVRTNEMHAEDEAADLENTVTDLKKKLAAAKGQITKLKKRVEKS